MDLGTLADATPIDGLHDAFVAQCPPESHPSRNATIIIQTLELNGITTVGDFKNAPLSYLATIKNIGVSATVLWPMVRKVHQQLYDKTILPGSHPGESRVTEVMYLHANDDLNVLHLVIKKLWKSSRLYYHLRVLTPNCRVGELFTLLREKDLEKTWKFGEKMLLHFYQLMEFIVLIDDEISAP